MTIVNNPQIPITEKERLSLIEKEFNSSDGILDFVVGLVCCLYTFYGISFFHHKPLPPLSIAFLGFIVIALLINSYQNHNVKKKYPDLSKKDLYSMSVSLDQMIMIPGFIGVMLSLVILDIKGIVVSWDYLINMLLFMLFAICGVTLLCFTAIKYNVLRLWLWFFLALFISISFMVFNYGWLSWYYLVGCLGMIMVIIGFITHMIFLSRLKKEIR